MKNKRIVVIGGAGFIGSHLCEELKNNNDVISVDNYFTGSEKNHVSNVEYIKSDAKNVDEVVTGNVDIVYHLGEYSRVEQSFEDFNIVMDYNTATLYKVLEFAKKRGAKLIYSGSSTKFSQEGRDSSPYAWSKATNTELVNNYSKWFGLDYAITYFYNVYGGREIKEGKYATLIAKFKEMKKNCESLTIVKPGTQKRNFTHINDIVNGLIIVGEKGNGDGYGIGYPKSYSILEIAEMFDCDIKLIPERKGNRMESEVKIEKTLELGWIPTVNLRDYLK